MEGYKMHAGKYVPYTFPEDGKPAAIVSDGEKQPPSYDEVAIAYRRDPLTVFTHGSKENVLAWVESHNSRSDVKMEAMVFHPGTPVEDVNAVLSNPELLRSFL